MQIDWFTVVAQLINFLVLVWLLKRFLYQPILDAIDAREQDIAKTLQKAAATQEEASNEREKLAASNADLDAQRAELLQKARDAATTERQQLLQEAHSAAEAIGLKQQQDRQKELGQLRAEIYQLALSEIFAVTRKLMTDLANTTLEQSVVEVFIKQLQEMQEDARKELIKSLTAAPAGGLVRSAFELDSALQQRLQNSVNEWAGAKIPLQFATSKQLICGLELSAKGHQAEWNIAAYLEAMQNSFEQLAAKDSLESVEPENA